MHRLELIFRYSASWGGCNGWWIMSDAIRWYDQNISEISRRYESVPANTVHGWLVDLLPNAPALVLDVGAGTGRDAAWLASRGLEVVAVEPSSAMRAEKHKGCILRPRSDGFQILCRASAGSSVLVCLSI